MASASLRALFSVDIQGDQLVVYQADQEEGIVTRTICTLDLRHQHSFYLSNDGVVCRDVQGFEFSLETHDSDETHELLAVRTASVWSRPSTRSPTPSMWWCFLCR
ncbi:hypothetical protein [Pseudomonas savastanoi]|uniref:hypothetical protein n=1 Tax=Pseudomonas savastanoi TaxID=29438 RepID=UPI001F1F7043|nr:hypothetical protein [Pseudomonas savastanoi]